MLDKKTHEVLHLLEQCHAASPTNVILFAGNHPRTLSTSLVCQVVCESALIIQLYSRMLDKKKRIITFVGAMALSLPHKCNKFRRRSSDDFVGVIGMSSGLKLTLNIQLHSHRFDINELLHLCERWCAASPTNVILFVGDHPTALSASSVCQVVCESTLIIQLH